MRIDELEAKLAAAQTLTDEAQKRADDIGMEVERLRSIEMEFQQLQAKQLEQHQYADELENQFMVDQAKMADMASNISNDIRWNFSYATGRENILRSLQHRCLKANGNSWPRMTLSRSCIGISCVFRRAAGRYSECTESRRIGQPKTSNSRLESEHP